MENFELEKLYEGLPESIESPIEIADLNKEIPIHEGSFSVEIDNINHDINGKIYFRWLPTPKIIFEGELIGNDLLGPDLHFYYPITLNGLPFGRAAINSRQLSSKSYWAGIIADRAIFGDKSIPVTEISFVVPNLKKLSGQTIKKTHSDHTNIYRGRQNLKFGSYNIQLDEIPNYKLSLDLLKSSGGYSILYTGRITSDNGGILYDTFINELDKIHHFFYFLDGRRSVPLFLTGLHEKDVLWTDYTPYHCDAYKAVSSWSNVSSLDQLQDICDSFDKYWTNKNDKDFLKTAIHWYVEANALAGLVEGAIILTQTALELIYNWLLIDKNNLLIGKDAENLSASNKIRLVLMQLGISSKIPKNLEKLSAIPDITDGPEVFVQIRNALVHGQEKKREALNNISTRAKYEALQLGLWYVELALLKILNYKGQYKNRVSENKWFGDGDILPWSN